MLSIMCITKDEPHARLFLDAMSGLAALLDAEFVVGLDSDRLRCIRGARIINVRSDGYLESIHDRILSYCKGDYVLRLDDDEWPSIEMLKWLGRKEYEASPLWSFPRVHLWGGSNTMILNRPLWPDIQTRCGQKWCMGGRDKIHGPSPHGPGASAPCAIEHHKFLVRPKADRAAILQAYDSVRPGCGEDFKAFSLPEDAFSALLLAPYVSGDAEAITAAAARLGAFR